MSAPRSTYRMARAVWTLLGVEALFWLLLGFAYLLVRFNFPNVMYHRPEWAWLLLAVPVITALQLANLAVRNKRLKRYADDATRASVAPNISTGRMVMRFALIRFGLGCLVIGLVDPKAGYGEKEVQTSGMELVLCLDVSKSMLAEDHSPNRLELAKRSMQQVLKNLTGDRVAVVVFAGEAYTTLPLTTDYEAAKLFVEGISTDMISHQGTAVGAAIDLALVSFSPEQGVDRAIVVITDGEDHEGGALSAALRAEEAGVDVHAVGIGSAEGAPIPQYRAGRQIGFKQDRQGNTVVTALNVGMLEELVGVTGGVLVRAGATDAGLGGLLQRLSEAEKTDLETRTFREYRHCFWWFILPGAALLLLESFIRERRQRWSAPLNVLDE